MIEYIHRDDGDIRKRSRVGKEQYLVVFQKDERDSIVIKGRINKWMWKRELGDYGDFVSDIDFLSQLIKKDSGYKEVQSKLEKRIEDKEGKRPVTC